MKLFLYSMNVDAEQLQALIRLTGKKQQINIAMIENATDEIAGVEAWLPAFRQPFIDSGFKLSRIDLRLYYDDADALAKKLSEHDIIWVGGGHTYYLRWILKQTTADTIIANLVRTGTVYAGWSAGAIMAGPTTNHFNLLGDDPADAPETIEAGLQLTDTVIVPHADHPDYKEGVLKAVKNLRVDGFNPLALNDHQVAVFTTGTMKIL
jgi:dipeptidase E